MKSILIALSLVIISSLSLAQQYEEVVYLKNGSVIRGFILEQIPNQSLKIKTGDNNIFVYDYDEIEKIAKEEIASSQKRKKATKDVNSSGIFHSSEISYGVGFGEVFDSQNTDAYSSLKLTTGIWITENIGLGFGFGFQQHGGYIYVPLTMDWRFELISSNLSPIVNVALGYRLDPYGPQMGFIINPSFGAQYNVGNDFLYFATIGLNMQEFRSEYYDYNNQKVTKKAFANYFVISMGLAF